MNTAVTPYDRLLISLAVAALSAVVLVGRAHAEDAGPRIDRYGGEAPRLQSAPALRGERIASLQVSAAAAGLRGPQPFAGRTLSWAGKSEAAFSAPEVPAPSALNEPAPERLAYAPAPAVLSPAPPPPAAAPTPPTRRSLPTTLYDSAPVAAVARRAKPARTLRSTDAALSAPAPVVATAPAAAPAPAALASAAPRPVQAYNGGVRHYSVHREFGIAPDATPIPPQFFTASADLSGGAAAEAEPLPRTPPTQTGTGKSGRARTVVTANPS